MAKYDVVFWWSDFYKETVHKEYRTLECRAKQLDIGLTDLLHKTEQETGYQLTIREINRRAALVSQTT